MIHKVERGEKMKTLKLALCKSKYVFNVPEVLDGVLFEYTPDVTQICSLESKVELSLLSILERKRIKRNISLFKGDSFNVCIHLYITGYTSMLISALKVMQRYGIKIIVYHFSKRENRFFPQEI